MAIRHVLLTALTAAAVAATQGTGYAACPLGRVHLTVRIGVPHFGDQNDLIYRVDVVNLGPDRATGLVVGQSTLMCATASAPLTSCQRIPPVAFPIADLDPGVPDTFPARVPLLTGDAVVVRTTVQVVRSDQHDDFSVLGGCRDGQNPQDACDTSVTEVSP